MFSVVKQGCPFSIALFVLAMDRCFGCFYWPRRLSPRLCRRHWDRFLAAGRPGPGHPQVIPHVGYDFCAPHPARQVRHFVAPPEGFGARARYILGGLLPGAGGQIPRLLHRNRSLSS